MDGPFLKNMNKTLVQKVMTRLGQAISYKRVFVLTGIEEKLNKIYVEIEDLSHIYVNIFYKKIKEFMRIFPKFKEQLILAAEEYKPNLLSNYLYEFAQKFNSFYNCVPVLVDDEKIRNERLKIVEAASQILKNGLKLLGVEVVEEM